MASRDVNCLSNLANEIIDAIDSRMEKDHPVSYNNEPALSFDPSFEYLVDILHAFNQSVMEKLDRKNY